MVIFRAGQRPCRMCGSPITPVAKAERTVYRSARWPVLGNECGRPLAQHGRTCDTVRMMRSGIIKVRLLNIALLVVVTVSGCQREASDAVQDK